MSLEKLRKPYKNYQINNKILNDFIAEYLDEYIESGDEDYLLDVTQVYCEKFSTSVFHDIAAILNKSLKTFEASQRQFIRDWLDDFLKKNRLAIALKTGLTYDKSESDKQNQEEKKEKS